MRETEGAGKEVGEKTGGESRLASTRLVMSVVYTNLQAPGSITITIDSSTDCIALLSTPDIISLLASRGSRIAVKVSRTGRTTALRAHDFSSRVSLNDIWRSASSSICKAET